MTTPPSVWVPALAAFAVRVMALVALITALTDFARLQEELRDYYGNQYVEMALELLPDVLLGAALCGVLALLAPALAAWSQLGAGRAAGPGEVMDRASRALIMVMAAACLLVPLVKAPESILRGWRFFLDSYEHIRASTAFLNEAMIAIVIALVVIMLSPALGAALNTARRALQRSGPAQASA
ncbi:MAG: hypothetical protein JJU18_04525 [Oceanicaulis sp.]|nr:hypothetical protein [Oceanicaulis sp.]